MMCYFDLLWVRYHKLRKARFPFLKSNYAREDCVGCFAPRMRSSYPHLTSG